MRGKSGELLLQLRALAYRALGLLGTIDDGFELVAATLADVFKNRHYDLLSAAV
jgi:hypothetical protein